MFICISDLSSFASELEFYLFNDCLVIKKLRFNVRNICCMLSKIKFQRSEKSDEYKNFCESLSSYRQEQI